MDKLFLRFVSSLYPVLERTGVDIEQLHEILRIKLLMDGRRPRAAFAAQRSAKSDGRVRNPWMLSFFTVMMGVVIGLVLFLNASPYIAQTLYFSIFMVIMALTLVSDFTTVLVDPRDQFILLPRPVNDRTIAVSRILHISIYVLRLALLQGLPGLIFIGFIDGILAVPLFFLQILEATFLSIFLVNIIYLVLMKFVSPQRFKDIISYFQIGFSVLIFATYYLLPRLIDVRVIGQFDLLTHWWAYFMPPVWIAAANEALLHANRAGVISAVLAFWGFVVPLIGLWLVAKVLAPGFNRRLAMISTSESSSNVAANDGKQQRINMADKLAAAIAREPLENAGFKITWKLAVRSREFKMKVYPSFAWVPIYFVYFALNGKGQGVSARFAHMQAGHSYIFFIYMCSLILSTILMNISMSSKYKSAWVYYALPVDKPGKILSGMYKAIVTLYFLPYCLVIGSVIVLIWGPQAINDVIVAFLVSLIYGILMALFMVKGLPFSRPVIIKQGGGRMITSLVILAFIGGIGYAHYVLMRWENVIWVLIIPLLLINWLMFHYYKRQTWESIELTEDF